MTIGISLIVAFVSGFLLVKWKRSFEAHDASGAYDLALFSMWGSMLALLVLMGSVVVFGLSLADKAGMMR